MIPEYSEYDVETNTHLTRAIQQEVEEKVRKEIRQGKTPTDQQVENWVQQEWEKAKQAVEHWKEVHKRQRETVKSLRISDRVLRRFRDDAPGIPDTLNISAYNDDWNRINKETRG